MSEPDPPPAPAEAIAAAVGPLLAGLPARERPTYDRVSHCYVEPLDAAGVAASLAPLFARVYVQHLEGEYEDRRLVARVDRAAGTAAHVIRDRFAEVVAAELLRLPDAPATASYPTRRAVTHVRLLAERGSASPYARRVAEAIADRLPYLSDLDPRPTFVRAGSNAASAEDRREQRLAYMREHSRAARERERESRRDAMVWAAAWLAAWRESAAPGPHAAPAVHAAYVAAAERSGMKPLGKKQLYQLADEVLGPRTRRASGPVYVVPEQTAQDVDNVAQVVHLDERRAQVVDLPARPAPRAA